MKINWKDQDQRMHKVYWHGQELKYAIAASDEGQTWADTCIPSAKQNGSPIMMVIEDAEGKMAITRIVGNVEIKCMNDPCVYCAETAALELVEASL